MRTYDSLFARARSAGTESSARVALSRLMYPKALRMEMKTEYERWLRENSEDVIRLRKPGNGCFFLPGTVF